MTYETDLCVSGSKTRRSRLTATLAHAAVFLSALCAASASATANPTGPVISVTGTILKVSMPDGRTIEGAGLVGGVLTIVLGGRPVKTRIAAVTPDPKDPSGEILLYDLRLIGGDGVETPFCNPDPDGKRLGFPLAGRRDATGTLQPSEDFEFLCTGGAQAKCVRFGYKPWAQTRDGQPLLDHYNACVRMVRADYCGDGVGHTRTGTMIDYADRIGISQPSGDPAFRFEANWNANGATCVARPRLPDILSVDDLAVQCPRLAGKIGPDACKPDVHQGLIFNFSR